MKALAPNSPSHLLDIPKNIFGHGSEVDESPSFLPSARSFNHPFVPSLTRRDTTQRAALFGARVKFNWDSRRLSPLRRCGRLRRMLPSGKAIIISRRRLSLFCSRPRLFPSSKRKKKHTSDLIGALRVYKFNDQTLTENK